MSAAGAPGGLVVAIPSKGRLQENAAAFFARAGLVLQQGRGSRDYSGSIAGLDGVELLYLSASEISARLAAGSVHLGVTGEDLIRESMPDADARVELLAPLGFGQANVVVAVPQAWIDVRGMADLEDVASAFHARYGRRMRVATKYVNLTRDFFARHGVGDYRIVESLGATEGAPANGTAELIVDITTTGATLAANALKVLEDGVMLQSEANLVASVTAPWNDAARRAAAAILGRIAAEERARTHRLVQVHAPGIDLQRLAADAAGSFGATLQPGAGHDAVSLQCARGKAATLAAWAVEQGAETASVSALDYVFSRHNPLLDRLTARIG